MDFMSFLILLIISLMVSWVLHYGMNFYITPGMTSYFSKVIIGWVGAYWGIQMLGHWWEGFNYGQVYFVPAILGCIAMLVFAVDFVKTWRSPSSAV